jgi:hypothetical protein
VPKKDMAIKKAVEDKTFGMKNKNKSKKMQQYIDNLQKSTAAKFERAGPSANELKAKAKAAKAAADAELGELFKSVTVQQKIPLGTDPKSIVCEFFKKGTCTKGSKCKFSHDWAGGRKSAKMDIYTDPREAELAAAAAAGGQLNDWSQEKLEQVVNSKEKDNQTEIVCKFFIEAVETRKYGYFWKCPNGETCKYRHRLPPGFVLKDRTAKIDPDDEEDEIPIEEQIEADRAAAVAAGKCTTPCTLENFLKWKEQKRLAKEAEYEAKKKEAAKTGNRGLNSLSGRDLFTYDPSLFVDDDEAVGDDAYAIAEDAPMEEETGGEQALYDMAAQSSELNDEEAPVVVNTQTVLDPSLFMDDDELPDEDDDDEDDEEDDDEPQVAAQAAPIKK